MAAHARPMDLVWLSRCQSLMMKTMSFI